MSCAWLQTSTFFGFPATIYYYFYYYKPTPPPPLSLSIEEQNLVSCGSSNTSQSKSKAKRPTRMTIEPSARGQRSSCDMSLDLTLSVPDDSMLLWCCVLTCPLLISIFTSYLLCYLLYCNLFPTIRSKIAIVSLQLIQVSFSNYYYYWNAMVSNRDLHTQSEEVEISTTSMEGFRLQLVVQTRQPKNVLQTCYKPIFFTDTVQRPTSVHIYRQ